MPKPAPDALTRGTDRIEGQGEQSISRPADRPTASEDSSKRSPSAHGPDERASETAAGDLFMERTSRELVAIELNVADHPGSLPQVCGLLARRSFQAEAVLCLPGRHGRRAVWLLVPADARLEQLTRQLAKLGDVLSVELREGLGVFGMLV